jgi:hypothetical protein
MLMRDDRPEARSVLAFPDVETYRTLARRTKDPLQAAGVALLLVGQDGSIVALDARDEEGGR